jgi:hypothetical protein
MALSNLLFFSSLVFAVFFGGTLAADYGILNLDNATLPKIVDGKRPVFLCFWREYPYGEKHDAFKALAVEVAKGSSDLIVGLVGIGTYGDKINQDLAERYGMKTVGKDLEYKDLDEGFPQFLFFPKGTASTGKPMKYGGAVTSQDMLRFLKTNGVKVGIHGTIEELDSIAAQYLNADKARRMALRGEVERAKVDSSNQDSKEYYLKVMQRITEKGNEFVSSELKRLESLLSNAVTKEKQNQFKQRANILASFLPHEER